MKRNVSLKINLMKLKERMKNCVFEVALNKTTRRIAIKDDDDTAMKVMTGDKLYVVCKADYRASGESVKIFN